MLADSYSLSQTHTHSHVVILNQVIRSLEEGLAVSTFLYLPSHGLIFLVSLSLSLTLPLLLLLSASLSVSFISEYYPFLKIYQAMQLVHTSGI